MWSAVAGSALYPRLLLFKRPASPGKIFPASWPLARLRGWNFTMLLQTRSEWFQWTCKLLLLNPHNLDAQVSLDKWGIRYGGVIRLLFSMIRHLYLIGVWLGWGWKNKHHKRHGLKEIGRLCLHILLLTISPSIRTEDNYEDICIQLKNQQMFTLITISKSREFWFSIQFLLMFHCRFSNATVLCVL